MRPNTLLVLSGAGWQEVQDHAAVTDGDRVEALLSLGALRSSLEAERWAQSELARLRRGQKEHTVAVAPRTTTETPLLGFEPGDWVTLDGEEIRCASITFGEDAHGNPDVVPIFGARTPTLEERVARTQKKMSAGTLGGDSVVATPSASSGGGLSAPAPTDASQRCEVVFSQGGPFASGDSSAPYPASSPRNFDQWVLALETAGASTTTIVLKKNGTTVGTFSITSGQTLNAPVELAVDMDGDDDVLTAEVSAAGTGAEGWSLTGRGRLV